RGRSVRLPALPPRIAGRVCAAGRLHHAGADRTLRAGLASRRTQVPAADPGRALGRADAVFRAAVAGAAGTDAQAPALTAADVAATGGGFGESATGAQGGAGG